MTKQAERKYRIRNWAEYNKSLINRGRLTIWFSEEAIQKWHHKSSEERGRPKIYSNQAILCALMIKSIYHQPLRALRGFLLSLMEMFNLALPVPCYTRICKRAAQLGQEIKKLERMRILTHPRVF